MKFLSRVVVLLVLAFTFGCGSDGGGGAIPVGGVSGHVPYLTSQPKVTFAPSSWDSGMYDVTVTLDADGPTGVLFVDLWIEGVDNTEFTSLELANIPGTKKWTATTNSYLPLPPGKYYISTIKLHDGDPLYASPLRSGWYIIEPMFSSSQYYVDERETSGLNFIFYNSGLSSIPVTYFTLP